MTSISGSTQSHLCLQTDPKAPYLPVFICHRHYFPNSPIITFQYCAMQYSFQCTIWSKAGIAYSGTTITGVTGLIWTRPHSGVTGVTAPPTKLEKNGLTWWSLWCPGSPQPKCPALGAGHNAEKVDTRLTGLLASPTSPDTTCCCPDNSQLRLGEAIEAVVARPTRLVWDREHLDPYQSWCFGAKRGENSSERPSRLCGQIEEVWHGNRVDQSPQALMPTFSSFYFFLSFSLLFFPRNLTSTLGEIRLWLGIQVALDSDI